MPSPTILSKEELQQYGRQLSLKEIVLDGQRRLKNAAVLIVGAGGLGSPLALYLTAAGIGRLGLIDADTVDKSNLHRQVIHNTLDLGQPKVAAACEKLRMLNPHISLEPHPIRLTLDNALEIIGRYDIVADGTDNFPTRYLINDVCARLEIPNVFGSIYQFEGQVSVFCMPDGPCYRCLHPTPPSPGLVPSCAEAGVLGILPGIVGSLQATEVIKLILGIGTPLVGRMLLVDTLETQFQTLEVERAPDCAASCQYQEPIDYESFCGMSQEGIPTITSKELLALSRNDTTPLILDVRHSFEADISSMGADLLIPLPELPHRLAEIEQHKTDLMVVHCHSGARSEKAVRILRDAGFINAVSLKGGIAGWLHNVDST